MGPDLINLGVNYVGSASDWDLLGTEIEASFGQTPSLPLQLLIHTAFSLAQRPYPPV